MFIKRTVFVAAIILVSVTACFVPSNVVETPRVENTRVPSATATLQIEKTAAPSATAALTTSAIPTRAAQIQTGALAFASDRDNAAGIYLTTLDGTISRLTREKYDASHPAWSPDGKMIAFDARVNGREELFVMNADGSNVRQLTQQQGDNFYPTWSPDSQQIAVASNREGMYQIYLMRADGSDVRRLKTEEVRAEKPAWSPDGAEIAYMLQMGGNVDIYATRVDGSATRRLTAHPGSDFNPAWSPDGKQIAFNSSRAGEHEIFLMDADGKNVEQLTNARGWSEKPAWSPDGAHIAFYSNRDGNAEVYVMDAGGANVQRLTNATGFDGQPTWRPNRPRAQAEWNLYDADPQHLWNRVFRLFFEREAEGQTYGRHSLDPLLWYETRYLLEGESHTRAINLLDEFLNTRGEMLITDPLKRALFQRDMWAVLDWAGGEFGEYRDQRRALQTRLAKIIHRVALSNEEIRALPDNYAQTVASRAFPEDYEKENSTRAFLPPTLFTDNSDWLLLGRVGGPIAMTHTEAQTFLGRSVFLVFMRVPNGREATRSLLAQLNDRSRLAPLLPAGTQVALVRRTLLVNNAGEIVLSPLVESVQLRHFDTPYTQLFFEFKLDRDALFASERGGLMAVQPGEKDFLMFQSHGIDLFEADIELEHFNASNAPVLQMCSACHFIPEGTRARAIISYSREPFSLRDLSAPVLYETNALEEAEKIIAWKRAHPSWQALR